MGAAPAGGRLRYSHHLAKSTDQAEGARPAAQVRSRGKRGPRRGPPPRHAHQRQVAGCILAPAPPDLAALG